MWSPVSAGRKWRLGEGRRGCSSLGIPCFSALRASGGTFIVPGIRDSHCGWRLGCLFSKRDSHFCAIGRILLDDVEKENTKRIRVR